jgi:hypothetical protein
MKRLIFYFLLFLTVSAIGCATQRKAEKFYDKHPEKLAEKCATEFPVIPTVDSSAYLKSKATVDSLVKAFDTTSQKYANEVRSLLDELEKMRQVPEQDWYVFSQKLSEYATLLEKRVDTLERQNKKLKSAVNDVKPVKETKPDLAKEAVLGSQIAKLNEANRVLSEKTHELSQERDTFKHERNKWRLRFFLLLFGVVLAYALKVKMTKKLW